MGAAVIIVLLIAFAQAIATNENIDFATIGEYLFNPRILSGVQLTLLITVIAMSCAAILAVIVAAMRMSGNPVMVAVAAVYVWAFRGTPLLVQIVIWGYFGLIFDKLTLGIPFTDIVFVQADTNTLITAMVAGIIALTLNEAAYSSEIVRSGMLSVDEGQREAAASLGMSPAYCFMRVLLPQAMRVIIPPMGNQLISMIKNTSLLSLIAVLELYTQATQISAQNLRQVELLIVVSIWYLAIVSVLSIPQHYLERYFGRGSTKNQPQTLMQRAREVTGSIQVQREHKRKRKAQNHV
ncbi:amino acid ABC transporter permease [Leucobacter rhizosphaerae]|uniref:Amino acid ABC transporter permease n=1 Tax=Leucobacter rhizosphaerae TaxID=2932245 RepID=A0ABY4FTI7_9MICO|nr:amino acid ABC transporter permease [Leucobacter rhizosphaerae]UOQ59614.1 amino acid ABC transporter permease [Leucobacter rhizosphaerae]